jgi:hypothetical protein
VYEECEFCENGKCYALVCFDGTECGAKNYGKPCTEINYATNEERKVYEKQRQAEQEKGNMDRLTEITDRLKAATPGPWKWDGIAYIWTDKNRMVADTDEEKGAFRPRGHGYMQSQLGMTEEQIEAQQNANAELIANAPSDISYLLTRLHEAEAERDKAKGDLKSANLCRQCGHDAQCGSDNYYRKQKRINNYCEHYEWKDL